jgi:hypothetical protein
MLGGAWQLLVVVALVTSACAGGAESGLAGEGAGAGGDAAGQDAGAGGAPHLAVTPEAIAFPLVATGAEAALELRLAKSQPANPAAGQMWVPQGSWCITRCYANPAFGPSSSMALPAWCAE